VQRVSRGGARVLRLMIATCLLLLAVPASASADTILRVGGRGYGHGIGLSQYGARGFAAAGYGYANILKHYYQGTTVGSLGYTTGSGSEPVMRVALDDNDTPSAYWTFTGHSGDLWVDYEGRGSGPYLVLKRGTAFTFTPNGSSTSMTIRHEAGGAVVVDKVLANCDWLIVWERDTTKPRWVGMVDVGQPTGLTSNYNQIYYGSMRLDRSSTSPGTFHLRNHVCMEDYIRCVVPRESPASWASEAIKAQAVVARSYAWRSRNSGGAFDVWPTTRSQAYSGWGLWQDGQAVRHGDNPATATLEGDWLSDAEVAATGAQVVKYGSTVVQTFYHSTSGGHTESIQNVWPSSAPQPYYTGVPDPYELTAGSSRHQWTESTLWASSVRSSLAARGLPVPGVLEDITVTSRGLSGRVKSLVLEGVAGDDKTLSGSQISTVRTALGLADTWFYVNGRTVRIAGADRAKTSVEISKRAFTSASAVIICAGTAAIDSLSAAGLAGAISSGAPILLTGGTSLDASVKAEVTRLGATKAYIVGGTGVVNDNVVAGLRTIPALSGASAVERVSGADRYATAAAVAREIASLKGAAFAHRAIIVNGDAIADGVAVSPIAYALAWPVLVVRATSIPAATSSAVSQLGIVQTYVVGGTGVVSNSVAGSFQPDAIRVAAGVDRYDTAARVADWSTSIAGFTWINAYVASGVSLSDALAAGPLAGRNRKPLLFTSQHALPSASQTRLQTRRVTIGNVYLLGGEGAVGPAAEAAVETAIDY